MSSSKPHSTRPKELSDLYYNTIRKNLQQIIDNQPLSQNSLAKNMKDHGLDIQQSTINKYLCGDLKLQFSFIVKLCELFNISITDLVNENFTYVKRDISADCDYSADHDVSANVQADKETPELADPHGAALHIPQLSDKFIFDPNDSNFDGWMQSYMTYFFPTLSSAKDVLIGELTLFPSPQKRFCEAFLRLDTNRISEDGTPIIKQYTGYAIISTFVQSMYIILSSQKESELCVLNLRHFGIRHQHLDCRMAAVLTNSAGETHLPTTHRALISREPISEEHLDLVLPQLHLNSSDILISQSALEQLRSKDESYASLVEQLTNPIQPNPVYLFKEDYVRSNADQILRDRKKTMHFISVIRDLSYKTRYNKVSKKVDEYVHNFLCSLGYYETHNSD